VFAAANLVSFISSWAGEQASKHAFMGRILMDASGMAVQLDKPCGKCSKMHENLSVSQAEELLASWFGQDSEQVLALRQFSRMQPDAVIGMEDVLVEMRTR